MKQPNQQKKKRNVPLQSMDSPSYLTDGARNSFMTDNTPGGLRAMLDQSSGHRRSEIYSKCNQTGVSTSGISGQSGNMYLDCLVDPSRGPIRLPDEYDKPTAVHQEVLYTTVTTGASGSFNPGAFSIIVNPFIGVATPASVRDCTLTIAASNGTSWPGTSFTASDPDRATLAAICNNIRPVSASVYVTYIGDTLTNGGQIAAALIPGNGVVSNVITPTGQDLRLVANLALQPDAYSGPLSKGAYCFWSPEDQADSFFYSITQAQGYSYPLLFVSGVSTQYNTAVVRVTVIVNYEYTTPSRLVTSLPSPIEPALITHAKKVLQTQPNCMANDDHSTWWSRVLDGARGLFTTIGNGVYSLFHPSLQLVSQAAQDPGLKSAMGDIMAYRGGAGALASALTR